MDGTVLRSQIALNVYLLRDAVKVEGEGMDINLSRDADGKYTAWVFIKLPGGIPQAHIKGAVSDDAESALDFEMQARTEFGEGSFVLTAVLDQLPQYQQPEQPEEEGA
ncbi:uncharacterized protein RCC_00234 [Ramularia collo-cygni]|uniref:Uncharacterized protein n=1 Tax=Ramularia collo-cygni TaxID=112498 RepID=A0A2D3UYJ7_9PEZI|nr:uncharacterized protein RCC_00234 [Ramularia collo-cygni]CZT14259.1 uncharacterized protein RCC_00234 [Ramularia collo-cygni]